MKSFEVGDHGIGASKSCSPPFIPSSDELLRPLLGHLYNHGPGSPLTWVVGRWVTGQHYPPTFVSFHWVSFFFGEFLQNWR